MLHIRGEGIGQRGEARQVEVDGHGAEGAESTEKQEDAESHGGLVPSLADQAPDSSRGCRAGAAFLSQVAITVGASSAREPDLFASRARSYLPSGDLWANEPVTRQIVARMKSGSGGRTFPGFHPGY
ncbi:hypothetical protein D3C78_1398160 [compost metagenome]